MAFNLREFTAEINKTGFARPSYFMMMITLPHALVTEFPEFGRSMQFRVEACALPTRILLSADQRYYGAPRRIPYGFASQDMAMTVILSEDMREREVFMRWQDLAVGNARTRRDGLGSPPVAVFDAGYYKDATDGATVTIKTYATSPLLQGGVSSSRTLVGELTEVARSVGFDPSIVTDPLGFNLFGSNSNRQIDSAYAVDLVEPFPINVAEVPLNWSEDGYARLNVIMQHRYAKEVNAFAPNPQETAGNGSIADLLRNGIQIFNRFQPAISLIRANGLGGALSSIGNQIENNVLANVRVLGRI